MADQNFKNHSRFSPLYHYGMSAVCIASLILSIRYFFFSCCQPGGNILSIILILLSVGLLISFLLFRKFPLKAQDRAIRAEENLRYFSMTGKLFDKNLTIQQIIALRFAEDDEFVELADKAVKENMSPNDIKKAIKNWKADNHRV
jgi:hypothetical protein